MISYNKDCVFGVLSGLGTGTDRIDHPTSKLHPTPNIEIASNSFQWCCGGPVPLGRGGRGAGSALPGDQSDDDVGYRRGAPRARVANSGQNANSAEMERHGVELDVAFAPISQSSAAASSSETAAVQPRTSDASLRTRPGTVATLSYDSSSNTEVSQLKASQRTSPGNSSLCEELLCAWNEHLWMQSSYVSIDCSFCW